jgi:CRISPR/Cas system-associated endonuclease Cas3-HD
MKLTAYERESALWKKLEEHMIEKLGIYRSRNDGDLNEIETARLRGRISQVKEFLALSEAPEHIADGS